MGYETMDEESRDKAMELAWENKMGAARVRGGLKKDHLSLGEAVRDDAVAGKMVGEVVGWKRGWGRKRVDALMRELMREDAKWTCGFPRWTLKCGELTLGERAIVDRWDGDVLQAWRESDDWGVG